MLKRPGLTGRRENGHSHPQSQGDQTGLRNELEAGSWNPMAEEKLVELGVAGRGARKERVQNVHL